MIPLTAFGFSPQNYFWMWPTAVFLTVAVARGRGLLSGTRRRAATCWVPRPVSSRARCDQSHGRPSSPPVPNDRFAPLVGSAQTAGDRVARPVARGPRTRGSGVTVSPDRVIVDHTRASFGDYVSYSFLAELQRAGIEFTFPAGSRNLDRFGP